MVDSDSDEWVQQSRTYCRGNAWKKLLIPVQANLVLAAKTVNCDCELETNAAIRVMSIVKKEKEQDQKSKGELQTTQDLNVL